MIPLSVAISNAIGSSPKYGAYSNSKIDSNCPAKFKKKYIDREDALSFTRFGTNIGSWIHEIAERQVILDMGGGDPVSVEDMVDSYIQETPEAADSRGELEYMLSTFRERFVMNKDDFFAAEQKLGATLDMQPSGYDSELTWFRGRVDYMEVDSLGIARIVDFKTYPHIHSDADINNIYYGVGFQLMGYLALIMALDENIKAGYYEVYYFRFGATRESNRRADSGITVRRYVSREEVEHWWGLLQRRIMGYERNQKWAPTPSPKACQYCPYIKTCPMAIPPEEFVVLNEEQAKEASGRLTVLKEVVKREDHALTTFLKQSRGEFTVRNGSKIGFIEKSSYRVDTDKFLEVTRGVNISPFISVSKTALDKAKKAYPHLDFSECLVEQISTRKVLV